MNFNAILFFFTAGKVLDTGTNGRSAGLNTSSYDFSSFSGAPSRCSIMPSSLRLSRASFSDFGGLSISGMPLSWITISGIEIFSDNSGSGFSSMSLSKTVISGVMKPCFNSSSSVSFSALSSSSSFSRLLSSPYKSFSCSSDTVSSDITDSTRDDSSCGTVSSIWIYSPVTDSGVSCLSPVIVVSGALTSPNLFNSSIVCSRDLSKSIMLSINSEESYSSFRTNFPLP